MLRKLSLAHDRVLSAAARWSAGHRRAGSAPRTFTGVRLADGSQLGADLTVVSAGKRCKFCNWFSEIGARELREESGESGVIYIGRFYRLPEGRDFDRNRIYAVSEGYIQGGVIEADNRTFGTSLTVPRGDVEPAKCSSTRRSSNGYSESSSVREAFADGLSHPISDVAAMAGVTNRWRELLSDGEPLATGVLPVGDSLMVTNPVYGRGMSTTAWSVDMLLQGAR